ncbi:MAG: XrtA/PEP-CTERM system histidine kinase PrsK [Opitutaceae bacterium]
MPVAAIFAYAGAACAGALAVAGALSARRLVARWSFAAGMALLAVESIFAGRGAVEVTPEAIKRWLTWQLVAMAFLPGIWLLFSLSFARGNGQEFLVRGRTVLALAFLLPLGIALGFRESLIITPQQFAVGAPLFFPLSWPGLILFLLMLVAAVGVVMNLERTFRASVGTMRWRIKFMLLGVGVLFIVRIYTSTQTVLSQGVDLSLEGINSGALLVGALLMVRSFFRTGHFDLDVYPSQSVLQNSLTVVLAGAYLVIVGILARVVKYLGYGTAVAAFVVLLSLVGLAVGLQSDRVRLALRRFVSRNFQRPLYDYRTVWKKFTEGTASRVEQADLCRSLVKLVAEMFQALSVSMWIIDEKRETLRLAGSTSLPVSEKSDQELRGCEAAPVIQHFSAKPEPIEIESSAEEWAEGLRKCHPTEFPEKGGNRVCIPMIGRGEILGVITLGDRVGGAPFTLQDFDLLKCVGDHAAAGLLNAQLSQKLLQAKELESFQTMAAFFVHDLKNAASTLNLMLKNLPVHFADPAFREDALRGMAKTVTHINHLIGRLGLLRHELKVQLAPSDLNEVVRHAISGLEKASTAKIVKELPVLPKVYLDREQIDKVVTNLVLNATEAVGGDGEVRIATSEEGGWAVLSVQDNGCGMSPEFMARSLFRPFQTTKKNGLGIGMFQSKMIVEAHGGRIAVSSEPGKGTTFRVLLRASASS